VLRNVLYDAQRAGALNKGNNPPSGATRLALGGAMAPIRAVEIDYLAVVERQFNNRRLPAAAMTTIIDGPKSIFVTYIDELVCNLPWALASLLQCERFDEYIAN
jgi:hypothetical protein